MSLNVRIAVLWFVSAFLLNAGTQTTAQEPSELLVPPNFMEQRMFRRRLRPRVALRRTDGSPQPHN